VKVAPLPAGDQVELAKEFVARRALTARPKIFVQQDALRTVFSDDIIMSKSDVLSLLCWFAPQQVLATLEAMIGEQKSSGVMSAAARDQEIARLMQRLLELEQREEALIAKAHAAGIVDLMRRSDVANPGVVLGVVVKAKTEAAA